MGRYRGSNKISVHCQLVLWELVVELVRPENVGICDEDVYNSEHPLTSYTARGSYVHGFPGTLKSPGSCTTIRKAIARLLAKKDGFPDLEIIAALKDVSVGEIRIRDSVSVFFRRSGSREALSLLGIGSWTREMQIEPRPHR